ncbi:MAG: hypothetical protein ACLSE6_08210 [Alphaproteobacteria bacterium]
MFELMIYPNLLSVLFIAYFARCDLHKLWRIPLKMKFLFAAALFFITLGQYTPIFLKIPVVGRIAGYCSQFGPFDQTHLFSPPPDAAERFLVGVWLSTCGFLSIRVGDGLSPWGVLLRFSAVSDCLYG